VGRASRRADRGALLSLAPARAVRTRRRSRARCVAPPSARPPLAAPGNRIREARDPDDGVAQHRGDGHFTSSGGAPAFVFPARAPYGITLWHRSDSPLLGGLSPPRRLTGSPVECMVGDLAYLGCRYWEGRLTHTLTRGSVAGSAHKLLSTAAALTAVCLVALSGGVTAAAEPGLARSAGAVSDSIPSAACNPPGTKKARPPSERRPGLQAVS
jgi:hypothetical protein